ncbi:hypothetical protein ACFC4S_27280 [Priestia megaterium]|uniref:hypothetical protein n=1 Tax=Priestia megaterium TaxID=1404 RepID=UPI001DE69D0E|nr:hypothetical protein [Priestia megaterium]
MVENVWLVKTFKEWAKRFTEAEIPYVALDEHKIDQDYGKLTEEEKKALFANLKENSKEPRQWGAVKGFFDQFYNDVSEGDIVVIGTGQTTKFNTYAVAKVTSGAYYIDAPDSTHSRHRRNIQILWQGEPIQVDKWGHARRLELLNSEERLKQFIEVYTQLKH